MGLITRFWATITYVFSIITLSPLSDHGLQQQTPLFGDTPVSVGSGHGVPPIFKPPGGRPVGDGADFVCDYSNMPGWRPCSTSEDRGCWLTDDNGGRFDINTDYEFEAPKGILRKYVLNVTDGSVNADGLLFQDGKLFNETYPGPWLQACWGDTVEVTVNNNLAYNGTSIHWHGIRQNLTMQMDGVNGITQCPIAPGDSFVYNWTAVQYGSTWYHSHYSLQYADGLVGPLTIHGPSSYPYDEAAKLPLLMTDWGHNSAFEAAYSGLTNPSILLNGHGNVTRYSGVAADLTIPTPYTIIFERQTYPRPKRYLLRLINTSFDTTFVFSIDNHILTVMGADFVPIHSYSNTSVLIGIGQRYHVVVEASPIHNASQPIPHDRNFWMRTYVAECRGKVKRPENYELSGILRYNSSSSALPTSSAWNDMSKACSDETYSSLQPILTWQVEPPSNGHSGEEHDVILNTTSNLYPLAAFALDPPESPNFNPLRINYSDPIFLRLNNTGSWPENWVVVPEDYSSTSFVYLVLAGDRKKGDQTTGAHPIHLHGHDFAILQQEEAQPFDITKVNLTLDNPPRRDVVLLPRNGFVIIAFKTDNPGSWLMHCHIAEHASSGLAMQILERRKDANIIWPFHTSHAIMMANQTCVKWNKWYGNCMNWWPDTKNNKTGCDRKKESVFAFQDDSGI